MINYLKLILHTIKQTFNCSGRASRQECIIFHLFYFILIGILFGIDKYYDNTNSLFIVVALTISYITTFVLTTPPIFSLIIRRLHDLNASGWWLLITLIPFGLILFFALPFKKGTEGANRYGEPPKI